MKTLIIFLFLLSFDIAIGQSVKIGGEVLTIGMSEYEAVSKFKNERFKYFKGSSNTYWISDVNTNSELGAFQIVNDRLVMVSADWSNVSDRETIDFNEILFSLIYKDYPDEYFESHLRISKQDEQLFSVYEMNISLPDGRIISVRIWNDKPNKNKTISITENAYDFN